MMSATDCSVTGSDEAPIRAIPRRTRIDAAHQGAGWSDGQIQESSRDDAPLLTVQDDISADADMLEVAEGPEPAMLAAVLGQTIEAEREQLQLQVAQVAGHLRERLREMDRRESQLNARVAQLEADLRAARIWVREREKAFVERENELCRRVEELEDQSKARPEPGLEPAAHDLEAKSSVLTEHEEQLRLREDVLDRRQIEIEQHAAAIKNAEQLAEQQRERHEREMLQCRERHERESQERIRQREEVIEAAEAILAEHAQRLDRDRALLINDQQSWEQRKSRQRQAVEERSRAAELELAEKRQRLEARQEWIERQKGALQQMRSEILAVHRQSLEMRLLAEQLWAQMSGRMTQGEVAQAIAQLRQKLAEQYRLEEESLDVHRQNLVQLNEQVSERHRELVQLRTGLRQWAAARQGEIEEQAAALVERELALDQEQEEFRRAERQWQAERRKFEQQIRELASQLRSAAAA